jgi:alpha-L-rhamnosidase
VGIDVAKPRLSWQITSDQNGFIQGAFEIRVAESLDNLKSSKKLIWESGKVNSEQSFNIAYEGPALKSMQNLFWQVRVWDNQGKASPWSSPASWEMGLLSEKDWSASWITAGFETDNTVSRPSQYYRKEFSTAKKVKLAKVYVTSLGLYELYLNGKKVGNDLFTPGWTSYNKRLQYQTYDVTAMLGQNNTIGAIVGDGWYRGNIGFSKQRGYYGNKLALLAQLQITYTDGTSETITTDSKWKGSTGPILES